MLGILSEKHKNKIILITKRSFNFGLEISRRNFDVRIMSFYLYIKKIRGVTGIGGQEEENEGNKSRRATRIGKQF